MKFQGDYAEKFGARIPPEERRGHHLRAAALKELKSA